MAEKLDFSLPQKKSGGSAAGVFPTVLLVVLVILTAVTLVVTLSSRRGGSAAATRGLSAQQVKELASKLMQRNLYPQAAAAWQDYLATARLGAEERARVHFQIGVLLQKAGLYGQAVEHFYRSEVAAKVSELGPQINDHVKECFENLGEFSALRYEVMDRTSMTPSQPAGGKVVAEIGAEKITESQLDALIEENIENQLTPMKSFMTPEQFNEQKKRALEQSRDPQAKQEFLQGWLAQEILYRQALQDQLTDKPEVKRVVHELMRGALSQQLMNEQLASRIHITDGDVQTYYTANKDQYVEPERAKIRHIRVKDEGRAKALLNGIAQGEDFAELARQSSEDESTKANGGLIQGDVVKGPSVTGIGDSNEINAAIFAAGPPAVLDKPFKTDKGWEVIKVEEKHPQRQKSFDEVRQQVTMQLLRQKREDVQREYIREMMDKHGVIIHTSVLAPARQADLNAPAPKP
ncbi:MAG: peptidyl-prolyl cis-trans isomerase [Sedimentisphaerales bacterium]|nr:peptidyl-prolyl cis-trans isomerase [Sedimentisphaerales bacterium]